MKYNYRRNDEATWVKENAKKPNGMDERMKTRRKIIADSHGEGEREREMR